MWLKSSEIFFIFLVDKLRSTTIYSRTRSGILQDVVAGAKSSKALISAALS